MATLSEALAAVGAALEDVRTALVDGASDRVLAVEDRLAESVRALAAAAASGLAVELAAPDMLRICQRIRLAVAGCRVLGRITEDLNRIYTDAGTYGMPGTSTSSRVGSPPSRSWS